MRTIKRSTQFKKDFKRILSNPLHKNDVPKELEIILSFLLKELNLPKQYKDHALIGNWKDYRECHIKPDVLLIYKKKEPHTLLLARIGSHAELFKK